MMKYTPHARFERAKEQLFALALGGTPTFPEVYQVLSPSKGGKSFLLSMMEQEIHKILAKEGGKTPSDVPIVRIELKSPIRGAFDYAAMYREILRQVHPHAKDVKDKDLPEVVSDGLKKRNTRYVLCDESHHLLNASRRSADEERMRNQFDSLKGVVNDTQSNLRLVLFGGPSLARGAMINSHFFTRSSFVLLGAYNGAIAEDRGEFQRLLNIAMAEHKVAGWTASKEQTIKIMNRCQGLIGLFWERLHLVKRRYGSSISIDHVMAGLPSPIGMAKIVEEINEMRALEAAEHPVSDIEFAGVPARLDAEPPNQKVRAIGVGRRGNVRDPACTNV